MIFLYRSWEGYLLPYGVETLTDNDDVYVLCIFKASVNTGGNKHKILILVVYLL